MQKDQTAVQHIVRDSRKPVSNTYRQQPGTPHSSLRNDTRRKKISAFSESLLAVVASIAIIALWQWYSNDEADTLKQPLEVGVDRQTEVAQPARSPETEPGLLSMLAQELNRQWPNEQSGAISDALLQQASDAVAQQNEQQLGKSMMLLGANALHQDDPDTAAVYLDEALAVFEDLENELGIANVEMLRGELNLKKRESARRAAYAYDAMQLAGWKAAKGHFHEAIEEFTHVIDENLAMGRYGAAASAYQSLYKGYQAHGQDYEAQQAGIEIVKLHASSGRPLQAQAMLKTLQDKGLDQDTSHHLLEQTLALQLEYEKSVKQLSRASDYQQLYHHFINAGDPVRAWQFRVKSQRSLQGVSKRAMHRRQTGVMALLYTSNDHMKNAERSLNRASRLYSENAQQGLSEASAEMRQRIF